MSSSSAPEDSKSTPKLSLSVEPLLLAENSLWWPGLLSDLTELSWPYSFKLPALIWDLPLIKLLRFFVVLS